MKYKEKDRFSIELFFGKEKGNLLILLSKLKPNNLDNKIIYTYRNKEVLEYEIDTKTLTERDKDNIFFKKYKEQFHYLTKQKLISETFKLVTDLDVEKYLYTLYLNKTVSKVISTISYTITLSKNNLNNLN
jgi:hypothetical protein